MGKWRSRLSLGRPTPARSRCFWSGISPRSTAMTATIPGSSSRTASMSSGSSATSCGGVARCLPGASGRSTTSSSTSSATTASPSRRLRDAARARDPQGDRAHEPERALGLLVVGRVRRLAPRDAGRSRVGSRRAEPAGRRPGTACRGVSRGARPARVLGRDRLRSRAVERLASDFGAWSAEPVFAYGFKDLTAAEWALLEALSARAEVTVSIPYEPGGRRSPRSSARSGISPDWRRARSRSSARRMSARTASPRRSSTSSGSCSPTPSGGAVAGRRDRVPRGRRCTRRDGARLRRGARAAPARSARGADRRRLRLVDRWRAVLDTVFVPLGIAFAIEQPARLGETAFGRALLGLLRFAWLEGRRGDLFRYLARRSRGSSGAPWTTSRAVSGGARSRSPSAWRRRPSGFAGSAAGARQAARGRGPDRRRPRAVAGDGALRLGLRLRRRPTTHARTPARTRPWHGRWTSSRPSRATTAPARPEAVVAALERTSIRPVAAGEAGHVPFSTTAGRVRTTSTS